MKPRRRGLLIAISSVLILLSAGWAALLITDAPPPRRWLPAVLPHVPDRAGFDHACARPGHAHGYVIDSGTPVRMVCDMGYEDRLANSANTARTAEGEPMPMVCWLEYKLPPFHDEVICGTPDHRPTDTSALFPPRFATRVQAEADRRDLTPNDIAILTEGDTQP